MRNGRNHKDPRIVSLLPAATELLCALGFERQIVGRSHECDFPPGITDRPMCTQPRVTSSASSRQINNKHREAMKKAISIFDIQDEVLAAVHPTHIVTQIAHFVDGDSLDEVERAAAHALNSNARVIALRAATLDGVWNDTMRLAAALDVEALGRNVVGILSERMRAVAHRTAQAGAHPRVACIQWIDPLMAAGQWMPELVALAGGVDVLSEPGRSAAWISLSDLSKAEPDVIVMIPCGFGQEQTRSEMAMLHADPGWRQLPAVRRNRVYLADGRHYFNRPGPRLVESLEILAEMLHPRLFRREYEGTAWVDWRDVSRPIGLASAASR